MDRFLSVIKNKYLIASLIFGAWMLFFDRHDLTTQFSYYSQKKELENEKMFYDREIEKITKGLHDIKTNPQEMQRIAREKYQMKKENEDVFILLYD